MYPERMSKVFIVGPQSRLQQTIDALHTLKNAHLIEQKKGEYDLCSPLKQFDKVSRLLVQVRSALTHLELETNGHMKKCALSEIEQVLNPIVTKVGKVVSNAKQTQDNAARVQSQEAILKEMDKVGVSPQDFFDSEYLTSFFGTIEDAEHIEKQIKKITSHYQLHTKVGEKATTLALFAEKKHREAIETLLAKHAFSEFDISSVKDLKGDTVTLNKELDQLKRSLEKESHEIEKQKKELRKKHGKYLQAVEAYLSIEAEKAQCPLSFGSTKESFFLEAYVPKKQLAHAKKTLQEAAKDTLHIEDQDLGDEEEIPIKLSNSGPLKNFEFFTKLYSLPRYNEYDPTKLMAFTFPLFMGFMLGDVIYGLIIIGLFMYLKKKIPYGRDFFNAMIFAGISTALFGAFFGEYMGFEPYHGPIVRTHDIPILMAISIIVGIIHVNFGLILGSILQWKNHGFMHALYEKMSWILIQISFVVMYLSYSATLPIHWSVGWGLFFLSAFLIYKGEGFTAVIEIPTIISHILSYVRLMAVGLASVFIAVMVDKFTVYLFTTSLWLIPLAIIFFILGQTLAIALGILSPSLHAIRLHYVEFFTKFYNGGGKEFHPFGAKEEKSLL